jgi:hypothetical protein
MGATYTRQSSYSDGDVITAAHTNDEFNQLLAAFQASSGHTHDGTANEGGPITKLLGTAITIGDATAGTDIAVTFDGETNDGVITWMEDEDHFKFSDDIVIDGTKRLYFNDEGGEYIHGDGTDLNLVSGADINIPANIGLTFGDEFIVENELGEVGYIVKKGQVILFPIIYPHGVSPIKKGTRKAIIGWLSTNVSYEQSFILRNLFEVNMNAIKEKQEAMVLKSTLVQNYLKKQWGK